MISLLIALLASKEVVSSPLSPTSVTSFSIQRKAISVQQRRANQFKRMSSKYSMASPKTSLSLDNDHDSEYNVIVSVGNPPQKFSLDLDTASGDLWVRGPHCQSSDTSCTGTKLDLSSDKSITPVYVNNSNTIIANFNVTYDEGTLAAQIYNAPVHLGALTINSFPIGVSTKEQADDGCDGFIGMALSGASDISVQLGRSVNLFDSLHLDQDKNFFALYLSAYDFSGDDGDSTVAQESGLITFGSLDDTKYSGKFTYFKCIPDGQGNFGYWNFNLYDSTVRVESNGDDSNSLSDASEGTVKMPEAPIATTEIKTAILDSGGSVIILTTDLATKINKAVGAVLNTDTQLWEIDCSLVDNGPDVIFNMNSVDFTIPAYAYIQVGGDDSGGEAQDDKSTIKVKKSSDESVCVTGFQGGAETAPNPMIILGDTFMRSFYTIFDKRIPGTPRIGMAPAVHPKLSSSAGIVGALSTGSSTVLNGTTSTAPSSNSDPVISSSSLSSSLELGMTAFFALSLTLLL